jgi:hypothetical protein
LLEFRHFWLKYSSFLSIAVRSGRQPGGFEMAFRMPETILMTVKSGYLIIYLKIIDTVILPWQNMPILKPWDDSNLIRKGGRTT